MEKNRLRPGTAASEAAAILCRTLTGDPRPDGSILVELEIGVTRVTRTLALLDLRRLEVLDLVREGDGIAVQLRREWRQFLTSDAERARGTVERLCHYGEEYRDVEARHIIDDFLARGTAF